MMPIDIAYWHRLLEAAAQPVRPVLPPIVMESTSTTRNGTTITERRRLDLWAALKASPDAVTGPHPLRLHLARHDARRARARRANASPLPVL